MSEAQYVGDFPLHEPSSPEHLSIVFSASMASQVHHWKNKNRSADFLADYFANFFPGADDVPTQTATRAEMRSAIGYIANELLENAIKFNHDVACHMGIQLHLYPNSIVFLSTNSMDPANLQAFKTYTQKLLESDPQEMYIQQLESNAENDSEGSGLGFLTMLNDYGTKLGWRFETVSSANGKEPRVIVSVRVELTF